VETPYGRVRCVTRDISLGGAQLEADEPIEVGTSLWLAMHKLRVFGIVQWARGKVIGVQFEEKLPKAIVLNLRGENVDPAELEEIEAILEAKNWVVGSRTELSGGLRPADVKSSRMRGPRTVMDLGVMSPRQRLSMIEGRGQEKSGNRRQALLFVLASALIGAAAGIGSLILI
jgi:hypothetical protein